MAVRKRGEKSVAFIARTLLCKARSVEASGYAPECPQLGSIWLVPRQGPGWRPLAGEKWKQPRRQSRGSGVEHPDFCELRLAPTARAEGDGLRPFPQYRAAGPGQAVQAFADGQEVIAGQLASLARKAGGAIGDQNFHLTYGTGMDNDQPRQGFMEARRQPGSCRVLPGCDGAIP